MAWSIRPSDCSNKKPPHTAERQLEHRSQPAFRLPACCASAGGQLCDFQLSFKIFRILFTLFIYHAGLFFIPVNYSILDYNNNQTLFFTSVLLLVAGIFIKHACVGACMRAGMHSGRDPCNARMFSTRWRILISVNGRHIGSEWS